MAKIFLVVLLTFGGSTSKATIEGAISLASFKLKPVLIPSFLASTEQAIMQAFRDIREQIATGLPRKNGLACCSTDAK